jgi:hypothetical protein
VAEEAQVREEAPVEGFPQPDPGAPVLNPDFSDPTAPGPTFDQGLIERIEENPQLASRVNEDPDLAGVLERDPTQVDQVEQDLGFREPSGVPEPAGATGPAGAPDQGFADPGLTEPPSPEPPRPDQDLDDTPGP